MEDSAKPKNDIQKHPASPTMGWRKSNKTASLLFPKLKMWLWGYGHQVWHLWFTWSSQDSCYGRRAGWYMGTNISENIPSGYNSSHTLTLSISSLKRGRHVPQTQRYPASKPNHKHVVCRHIATRGCWKRMDVCDWVGDHLCQKNAQSLETEDGKTKI